MCEIIDASSPDNKKELELISIKDVENNLGDADFNIAKEKFALARGILICLALLTVLIILLRIGDSSTHDDRKEIFDTIFQSIVPMSSLIIGYYFGSKNE